MELDPNSLLPLSQHYGEFVNQICIVIVLVLVPLYILPVLPTEVVLVHCVLELRLLLFVPLLGLFLPTLLFGLNVLFFPHVLLLVPLVLHAAPVLVLGLVPLYITPVHPN